MRINEKSIVYEILENELLIVNLEKGAYYSAIDVGIFIWKLIEKKATEQQIIDCVERTYEGEAIKGDVEEFLQALLEKGLIFPSESEKSVLMPMPEKKSPFSKPILRSYSDLQDVLLLDPLHEVDDSGWPHAAEHG